MPKAIKVSPARDAALKAALDHVRATVDPEAARARDPVQFVHKYEDPHDRELVGLIAATVAFGNVTTIRQKLADALERLAPSPSRFADDPARVHAAMQGWQHRVYRGEDLAKLVVGARRVQVDSGSLGARFSADLASAGDVREALARFCDAIRIAGGLPSPGGKATAGERRGSKHLLPDPRAGSGTKRLHLYLRWMIRPADGVDIGAWPIDPRLLVCPVDTHIHKLAKNLGLTNRNDVSFRTASEITAALARFDPADPIKYDFSLCHMGMLQRCPSTRDEARCEGCGVKPVCRYWSRPERSRAISGSPGARALVASSARTDGRQKA